MLAEICAKDILISCVVCQLWMNKTNSVIILSLTNTSTHTNTRWSTRAEHREVYVIQLWNRADLISYFATFHSAAPIIIWVCVCVWVSFSCMLSSLSIFVFTLSLSLSLHILFVWFVLVSDYHQFLSHFFSISIISDTNDSSMLYMGICVVQN